jgi:hypothetical protein
MADGLARSGFDIDLRDGQQYEAELADLLLALGGDKIEVKADALAYRTGNLFIEFRQPSGPSGLAVTTAHWWAFFIISPYPTRTVIVLVKTERLKQLCREEWREGNFVAGGDNNNYTGVLLPLSRLIPNRKD